MPQFVHFVSALLLTYFASRLTRLLPALRHESGVIGAHALAFAAVVAGLALLRWPDLLPSGQSLGLLGFGQAVWLVMDGLRARYIRRRRSD